ncbi:hypothetical protein P4C99_09690 [Pontiellaceae bacterium B1224]|nr:hypothetical protein [Pontiellaceae bacterium B1224]
MNPWYILLSASLAIAVFSYIQYKVLAKRFAQNWIAGKKTLKREYVSCCISHQTPHAEHVSEQVVSFLRRHKYVVYKRDDAYVAHTPSNLYRRPLMVKVVTLPNQIDVQIKDAQFQKYMGKAGQDIFKNLVLQVCNKIVELISSSDESDVEIEVQIGPLSKWEKRNFRGPYIKEIFK